MERIRRRALATEAAAVGGFSAQAFTPTEEYISALVYPGTSGAGCRGPAREGLSTVGSHRSQRGLGHSAPIATEPAIPDLPASPATLTALSHVEHHGQKYCSDPGKLRPLGTPEVCQEQGPGA